MKIKMSKEIKDRIWNGIISIICTCVTIMFAYSIAKMQITADIRQAQYSGRIQPYKEFLIALGTLQTTIKGNYASIQTQLNDILDNIQNKKIALDLVAPQFIQEECFRTIQTYKNIMENQLLYLDKEDNDTDIQYKEISLWGSSIEEVNATLNTCSIFIRSDMNKLNKSLSN
jgi:hypothetical protein